MKSILKIIFGKDNFEMLLGDSLPDGITLADVLKEFNITITSKTETLLSNASPTLVNISGIPGSGKTTYIRNMPTDPNTLLISFDELMESLSFYKGDFVNRGNDIAFSRWEPVAKILGYHLLEYAVSKRYNIVFEHSNALLNHIGLYQYIKSEGYIVKVFFLDIDLQTAIDRTKKRDRYVPVELIEDRYTSSKEINRQLQSIVDFLVVDNESS